MTVEENKNSTRLMPALSSLDAFSTTYGPFAFGIVSLLIIWFAIIAPFMEQQRLDFEIYSELNKQQGVNNLASESTVRTLHETAVIIDRVSERMERLSEIN